MHEMSVAMSIVEISEQELQKANAKQVNKLVLEIGTLSGIVLDALEFAMEEAVKSTPLQNAKREVVMIDAKARCLECRNEYKVDDLFSICPKCNSFKTEIIAGKEMKIKSLVVE